MVAISVTPQSILMTRNALSKTCPLLKRAIDCTPDCSNMVRKRAYSSSVNRTMTHFFAGSALRGLPGFPCLLREIRSSIAFNFAWRRRSPSVLNVDRYPAGYNDLVLPVCLCGGGRIRSGHVSQGKVTKRNHWLYKGTRHQPLPHRRQPLPRTEYSR